MVAELPAGPLGVSGHACRQTRVRASPGTEVSSISCAAGPASASHLTTVVIDESDVYEGREVSRFMFCKCIFSIKISGRDQGMPFPW